MSKAIIVNLPVADPGRAEAFYAAIGCVKDSRFSGEQAAMMVWSDTISFMLMARDLSQDLALRPIADAHATCQMWLSLACDSRAAVDAVADSAIAAGGKEHHPPEDLGFMYSRPFEDLDGHLFNPLWMDKDAAHSAMSGAREAA